MREEWIRDFRLLSGARDGDALVPHRGEIVLLAALPDGWRGFENAVAHFTAHADRHVEVQLGLAYGEAEEPRLIFHYRTLPRCGVAVPFPLNARSLAADFAFLPPWPGVFKGGVQGLPADAGRVRWLRLTLREPGLRRVALAGLCLTNGWAPQNVAGSPLVDAFGQRKAGSWPGKTQDLDALRVSLTEELRHEQAHGRYPESWSAYGGWLEKRFPPTGWFYRIHDGKRWWLVDPAGCAFFSNGMCYGHRTGIFGMADHLDSLHDWLPPKEGLTADAWATGEQIPQYVARNGLDAARTRTLVNFARANMMRVFGESWLDAWITLNAGRMRAYGINTIGVGVNDYANEPTRAFLAKAKIPYVITFKVFPQTRRNLFRDFPDVFSPEYAQEAARLAQEQLSPWKDDPYLIGYFVTNEPEWLMHEGVNLAERLLAQDGCATSKEALLHFLQTRYGGVEALNRAWATDYRQWADLRLPQGSREWAQGALRDLEAFHLALVAQYGHVVSQALKAVDPHHLNLGMRYNHASEKTLGGQLNCFDVFSFNCYGAEPATAARRIADSVEMPLMVGEWHVGAQDSGLDAWGLYYAPTQAQRAQAIRYYLEQSTQEPHLTGVHYFEYNDQPYLGRFDGECYNIGLIDVCNRPYPLVAKAFEDFASRMYPLLDGRLEPTATPVALQNIWARPEPASPTAKEP